MALRVGVTGHRPNRLEGADPERLRASVAQVLELLCRSVRDLRAAAGPSYADQPAVLRLVSALAEGADQIAALEALALDFELQAPLPFPRDLYREQMAPEGREAFDALLDQASAVLELDGSAESESRRQAAYEAVGRITLLHADVLIAIWDGAEARGRGGSPQIIAEALRLDVPTIWIDANQPHAARALMLDADEQIRDVDLEHAIGRLATLLLPPSPEIDDPERAPADLREAYFAERQPRTLLPIGWVWRTFRGLVELRPSPLRLVVRPFERTAEETWRAQWAVTPPLPPEVTRQIDDGIERHYAWADGLADYYADLYRSAFVLIYVLAAVAVLLALLGVALGWTGDQREAERIKLGVTIAGIGLILVTAVVGKRRRWHERWIDYRLLAESLRILRFLAPIGRAPPFSRPPAHLAHGDPTSSWMMWHLRAIIREMGMLNARFEPAYLESCRILLHDVLIGGQIEYHRTNAVRLERLERRLRRLGLAAFVGMIVVLIALFWADNGWLTLAEATLPALAGAFAAIRGQAELERLVKRSRAMSTQLQRFARQLEQQEPALSSVELGRVAEAAADVMLAEHLDWRVVFQQRKLELPG
jgi:hypothetical protein